MPEGGINIIGMGQAPSRGLKKGVVVNIEGQGPHARVQVNFEGQGSKWLMLQYANLTPT